MSIHADKKRRYFTFEFDRIVNGARVRTRKRLPKGWSRTQADSFDRAESARLYAIATGVEQRRSTISDAVALYLTDKAYLKTVKAMTQELGLVYYAFKDRFIDELPEVAREIVRVEQHRLAPASIRNRIAYLRAACRWGWKQHKLCEHDPGGRVQMPVVRNARTNFLSRAEAIRVARHTKNRAARASILIGFYSGMRVGEIIRALPVDGRWVVTNTKNGDDAYVPIHPKVAVYARRWPRKLAKITAQQAARTGMDAIGRPDASFHTLRHSTATAILTFGESLDIVGDILRHRDKRSTQRYAHRQIQQMAVALGKLGKKTPTSTFGGSTKT